MSEPSQKGALPVRMERAYWATTLGWIAMWSSTVGDGWTADAVLFVGVLSALRGTILHASAVRQARDDAAGGEEE